MRALAVLVLVVGCGERTPHATSAPAAALPPGALSDAPATPGPFGDPDHKRGALPDETARRNELHVLRDALDKMFAHRVDKEKRAGIDEDAWFAELEKRLVAADSWARYDSAIYDALAKFHDSHLTYHPPSTQAPSKGYTPFHLGLDTVLARDRLLVTAVEPGGDPATAGVKPGDEIVAIDGRATGDVLASAIKNRVYSRPESAMASWVSTWTHVLELPGAHPLARTLRIKDRDGKERDVTIVPREVPRQHDKHERASLAMDGAVAVVTIRSLEGSCKVGKKIDDALAPARAAKAIVLDLRGDRGGVDCVGYRVVADLAEGKPSLGSYRVLVADETKKQRPRWKDLVAEADGFSAPQPLVVDGLPAGKGFHGPIAVVVDAVCVSTCEVVVAALRADLHAVIVGEVTGGSSGAPISIELPASHSKVAIPTWNMVGADGKPIESDGVVPDVDVVPTPDALAAGKDLPLATAIDRVRAQLPAGP